jgi:hypothetical protein
MLPPSLQSPSLLRAAVAALLLLVCMYLYSRAQLAEAERDEAHALVRHTAAGCAQDTRDKEALLLRESRKRAEVATLQGVVAEKSRQAGELETKLKAINKEADDLLVELEAAEDKLAASAALRLELESKLRAKGGRAALRG